MFGPSTIYLFDAASVLPLTIQVFKKAAQKGVIVVWIQFGRCKGSALAHPDTVDTNLGNPFRLQ